MSAINLKQAVLSTAAFFDLFDYPLTLDELEKYLFGEIKHDRKNLEIYLKQSPKIAIMDGVFYLSDRAGLHKERVIKEGLSKKLWLKVNKFAGKLSYLPFIKSVCVCNNLAFNCPQPESDIDLFIITKKNRLFTARILITILSHILGVRRHKGKIAQRFCLSFFVCEENLDFSKLAIKPYDIYLAYWIKTLKPVIDNGVMVKFLQNNRVFLKRYFAAECMVDRSKQIDLSHYGKTVSKKLSSILGGKFGDLLERFLKKWQMKRAEAKYKKLSDQTGTVISEKMLKFHNVDRRNEVNQKWQQRVEELLT
ncbi:hypothetical protein KKG71_00545 [Patescibacteria group bacterium]|nr:hypothetical protein [Patescibacteria group bacterium]